MVNGSHVDIAASQSHCQLANLCTLPAERKLNDELAFGANTPRDQTFKFTRTESQSAGWVGSEFANGRGCEVCEYMLRYRSTIA